MAWRDKLQAGRFRAAEFHIDGHEYAGGRRLAAHEYPLRDEPYVEDLGRKAREFSIECFVLGPDYMAARDALRDALEDNGPGILVHPYLGRQRVFVRDYRQRETTRDGGMCTFSITFIEAGREAEPDATADTASAVDAAADAATAAMQARFAKDFGVSGQPQFVADGAVSQLSGAVSGIRKLSGRIGAGTQPISDFSSQLNQLGSALSTLIRTPAVLAAQVSGVLVSLAGVSSSVKGALNAYRTLWSFGNDAAATPATTPARSLQATNQAAINTLMQQAATIEAARAASGMNFGSSAEAASLRDLFTTQFDALFVTADDDTYAALIALQAALVRDLNSRAARLPQSRRIILPATIPALVLSHRLYGGVTLADDIVTRNRVRHPGFVPGGVAIEVLTDAA